MNWRSILGALWMVAVLAIYLRAAVSSLLH